MIVGAAVRMDQAIAPEGNREIGIGLDVVAVPGGICVCDSERVVLDEHAVIT